MREPRCVSLCGVLCDHNSEPRHACQSQQLRCKAEAELALAGKGDVVEAFWLIVDTPAGAPLQVTKVLIMGISRSSPT